MGSAQDKLIKLDNMIRRYHIFLRYRDILVAMKESIYTNVSVIPNAKIMKFSSSEKGN